MSVEKAEFQEIYSRGVCLLFSVQMNQVHVNIGTHPVTARFSFRKIGNGS